MHSLGLFACNTYGLGKQWPRSSTSVTGLWIISPMVVNNTHLIKTHLNLSKQSHRKHNTSNSYRLHFVFSQKHSIWYISIIIYNRLLKILMQCSIQSYIFHCIYSIRITTYLLHTPIAIHTYFKHNYIYHIFIQHIIHQNFFNFLHTFVLRNFTAWHLLR